MSTTSLYHTLSRSLQLLALGIVCALLAISLLMGGRTTSQNQIASLLQPIEQPIVTVTNAEHMSAYSFLDNLFIGLSGTVTQAPLYGRTLAADGWRTGEPANWQYNTPSASSPSRSPAPGQLLARNAVGAADIVGGRRTLDRFNSVNWS